MYKDCAQNSHTDCSVPSILSKIAILKSPSDLHAYLSERYPWFRFVILKLTKDVKAKVGGNLSVGHYELKGTPDFLYDITIFDVFTEFPKEKQNFSFDIDVDLKDDIDHFFSKITP